MSAGAVFVGTDLVHIPAFAQQLDTPGSRFESVFSAGELRAAATKPRRAEHLAGRWAAKEAFIKAWSQALFGRPPVMAEHEVIWAEIEVRADRWGRVEIHLGPRLYEVVEGSIGRHALALSISHDGEYATATCLLSVAPQGM